MSPMHAYNCALFIFYIGNFVTNTNECYALFISSQFWNFYNLKFYPDVRCFDVIVFGILVAAVLPSRKKGGVTVAESSDGFGVQVKEMNTCFYYTFGNIEVPFF